MQELERAGDHDRTADLVALLVDRAARDGGELIPWVETLEGHARRLQWSALRHQLLDVVQAVRMVRGGLGSLVRLAPLPDSERVRLEASFAGTGDVVGQEERGWLPERLLEDFTIDGPPVRGGFGVVLPLVDLVNGRRAALKYVRPGLEGDLRRYARERFDRERAVHARLAGEGGHSHLVPCLETFEDEGRPVMLLEWAHGGSVHELLAANSMGVSPRRARRLIRQLLSAVGWLHERSLVHRDLKPSNLLLRGKSPAPDHLWIADLGAVLDPNLPSMTTVGSPAPKTPDYAAPEQLGAGEAVGPRADLYATGVVALELLVGPAEARRTRLARGVGPSLPDGWAEFVQALLASKPDERPASAEAAAQLIPGGGAGEVVPTLV